MRDLPQIIDYDKDQLAYALANALKERDEAREDLEFRRGLYKVQEEYLETARRERDEAREELQAMARKALEGWK
jgi:hypothetical protein